MRIMILGVEYTMVTWYLQKKPNHSQCSKVLRLCSKHAVELENGDYKTLTKRELAKVAPSDMPDLWLPHRKQLPSSFKDTNCAIVRGDRFVRARRPGHVSNCRGVLFRCDDLRHAFPSKKARKIMK